MQFWAIPRLAVVLYMSVVAAAQVAPPSHEGKLHHLFAPHRDSDNLEARYTSLSCALVMIQGLNRLGTGFYVTSGGDIVTASHVVGDRVFNQISPTQMSIALNQVPNAFTVRDYNGEFVIPAGLVDLNADNWGYDLAVLHSGRHTNCWLQIGNDKSARPGQHLLTLGFPGLAFGSLTMYTGIMSGRLKAEIPIGRTVQGAPVKPLNDYLRVQMPISPGISGAPIIDDENRAIGVVTTAGVWGEDLEKLTELQRSRDQQPAQILPPGVFDLLGTTAHLAIDLHDFASPGYGDAVPLSYLVLKPTASPRTP